MQIYSIKQRVILHYKSQKHLTTFSGITLFRLHRRNNCLHARFWSALWA